MAAEKTLEKSSPLRLGCRHRLSAGYTRTLDLPGGIGFGFDIRLSTAVGHLHRGAALTLIGTFLVLSADITSCVAN